jgi:hypothetical protein
VVRTSEKNDRPRSIFDFQLSIIDLTATAKTNRRPAVAVAVAVQLTIEN